VLAGLCKRIAKDMQVLSVSSVPALDQVRAFLAGAAAVPERPGG
jgi:hypothetical protein